ncbi:MAG: hypothetical protein VW270_18140 [Candidatus Poseidoniales archaeon]
MGEVQVIALGGSLLRPDSEHDRHDWIEKIMTLLKQGISLGMKFILVVGGGAPAREHITIAKQFITSSERLDTIGIAATRLNATMLQQIFAANSFDVSEAIPTTSDQVNDMIANHSLVLMGGTVPGQTTDTVAVNVACKTGAEHCIIATNVSHVYSKDPREFQDAIPINSLSLGIDRRTTSTWCFGGCRPCCNQEGNRRPTENSRSRWASTSPHWSSN